MFFAFELSLGMLNFMGSIYVLPTKVLLLCCVLRLDRELRLCATEPPFLISAGVGLSICFARSCSIRFAFC